MMRQFLLVLVLFIGVIGPAQADDEKAFMELGASLLRLSRAVDAAAHRSSWAQLQGDALLQAAVSYDRSLLEPFQNLSVRVRRQGSASAVLICAPEQNRALLEDTGCTPELDSPRFRFPEACDFKLPIRQMCN